MLDYLPSPQSPRYALEAGDKVTIDGIAYQPVDVRDTGYVLIRLDGQGVAESFSRSEMSRFVDLGRVKHERGALLPDGAKKQLELPSDMLSKLPASHHRRARLREATVLSFLELEELGKVNRTEVSIEENLSRIKANASKKLKSQTMYDDRKLEHGEEIMPKTSARSVRRWVAAYEDLGLSGLFDRTAMRGDRSRRLCPASLAILTKCAAGFMCRQKPSQAIIYQDVIRAFSAENDKRCTQGRPELAPPSKETVRQAILDLDPYQCMVAREGLEKARRKFAPVGRGLKLTRPLERVELDTWTVDLISILAHTGVLHYVSEEDLQRLGLTGKKVRWYLTVAICATTRCIVAMRLSRSPNTNATIQTIDMIMSDKGVWSDAVGALSPWHMRGTPSLIVADCGNEYVSYDVHVAARDLGIRVEHAPAGLPEMRARVERFFKTISIQLMPRLTGRTFSNIIERGDYDSRERAALTADELCEALIRYVVDIYHRQPHEGLDGETPLNCWDRLSAIYGIPPAADLELRRIAFGTRTTRTAQKDGITIYGVRYHAEALAEHFLRANGTALNIRWYAEDLGAIAVEIGDEWMEVPSVFSRFRGVRAQTWLAARRALAARFKHQASLAEGVVFRAIADIEAMNDAAMQRIGLVTDDHSADRLRLDEERLFIGFGIEPDADVESLPGTFGGFGEELASGAHDTHEFVTVMSHEVADPVSAPAPMNANPDCSQHPRQSGDADGLGFEIEDK